MQHLLPQVVEQAEQHCLRVLKSVPHPHWLLFSPWLGQDVESARGRECARARQEGTSAQSGNLMVVMVMVMMVADHG